MISYKFGIIWLEKNGQIFCWFTYDYIFFIHVKRQPILLVKVAYYSAKPLNFVKLHKNYATVYQKCS